MKEIGFNVGASVLARAPGAQTLTILSGNRKPENRKPETLSAHAQDTNLAIRYTPTGNGLV